MTAKFDNFTQDNVNSITICVVSRIARGETHAMALSWWMRNVHLTPEGWVEVIRRVHRVAPIADREEFLGEVQVRIATKLLDGEISESQFNQVAAEIRKIL